MIGLASAARVVAAAVLASTAFAADTVQARDVLGRSVVGGRTVVLFSDGTWRFDGADVDEQTCADLGNGIAFCGEGPDWRSVPPPNAVVDALYQHDDSLYGHVISEGIGRDNGLTLDGMVEIALSNAAGASGVIAESIPVVDAGECDVDGVDGRRIVFLAELGGLDIVFATCLIALRAAAYQATTYQIAREWTDDHRSAHDAFLAFLRISRGDL